MKRKIKTLTALALITPHFVFADYFEGFYGGVGLGATQTLAKFDQTNDINFTDNTGFLTDLNLNSGGATKHADNGIIGNINFGYNTCFNARTLLGVEMRGYIQNTQMDHNQHIFLRNTNIKADFYSQTKLKYQFAALAKLGWLMHPQTQIYGIVGPQWGQLKSNATIQTGPINSKNTHTLFNHKKSVTKGGYMVGLGLEHAVSCNSTVGLEYSFSSFGDINVPREAYNAITNAPLGAIKYTNHVRVNSNTTLLKYNYYFCG